MLASESCALSTAGAEFVRDVLPGEIVRLDEHGVQSTIAVTSPTRAFCVFEYVYFARPDSLINNVSVHTVRQELGRMLARECPCPEGDVVVGVPDSSIPMALGYAQASGLRFTEGLCKNRYIGRTFIQPTTDMRKTLVNLKYNALPHNFAGMNVVLVDDSLVRGHTIAQLLALFRKAGAKSIHVRIASPPIRHPCYMGIDMKSKEELVASCKTVDEIKQLIGADSLHYLSHDGLMKSVQSAGMRLQPVPEAKVTIAPENTSTKPQAPQAPQEQKISQKSLGLCSACFTGEYPLDIEDIGHDFGLEV